MVTGELLWLQVSCYGYTGVPCDGPGGVVVTASSAPP